MSFVEVKTGSPDYQEGTAINITVTLAGAFLFQKDFELKVFDNDTGEYKGGIGGTLPAFINKVFSVSGGTMPNRDINLRVDLIIDGATSSRTLTAVLRPPSVVVGPITLNPNITQPEAAKILQEAGVSPEVIIEVLPKFVVPTPTPILPEAPPEGGEFPTPIPPKEPTGTSFGGVGDILNLPELPWYVSWLKPVLTFIGSLTESVANFFAPIFSPLSTIADYLKDPFGLVSKHIGDIFTSASKSSIDVALQATKDATSQSPDFVKDMRDTISTALFGPVDHLIDGVTKDIYGYKIFDPLASIGKLADYGKMAKLIYTQTFYSGAIAEAVSLGQFEAIQKFTDMVLGPFGLATLANLDIILPLEPSLITPAKQYWRSIYPNEIPSTNDLINMVVKEKISIDTFKTYMKYQGINEDWSSKIWDAHFNAPSLGQLLTSWRRNHISTEQLDKYEILVDLDPIYKLFWNDQRYVDPSIMSARFMFETGSIKEDGVRDILKRNGLFPSDIDAMTKYIVTFQERLWRRRYIMAVASGYRQGVYNGEFLTSKILEAGYTVGVANWMIQTENVRGEIARAKVRPEKDVLVTLTIAIDAYINNDVDELWLRNYFYTKGYDAGEIELAIKVYNRKKASAFAKIGEGAAVEGVTAGSKLSMNVVTRLYVEDQYSEQQLRDWFIGKGYSLEDTDLYIKYWNSVKIKGGT